MNYLIAGAINLIGMLIISSLMANALTRFYWHGRGTMSVFGMVILAGLFWMVPCSILAMGDLQVPAGALWFGNWLVSGFAVVILCQSVRLIPLELGDSARLDGCGWIGTYRHIVMPLVRRELGLIALLTLMATPILFGTAAFTAPEAKAVPPWLHLLLPMEDELPGRTIALLTMAGGSILMTLPVIVIFFLSKSWFLRPARLGHE